MKSVSTLYLLCHGDIYVGLKRCANVVHLSRSQGVEKANMINCRDLRKCELQPRAIYLSAYVIVVQTSICPNQNLHYE
jgi:hypothetical protein